MIGKLWLTGLCTIGMAMGQAPVVPQAAAPAAYSAPVKPLAFDVVSIRQNLSNTGTQSVGPTPDGYDSIDLPLMLPILTAFVPSGGGMFSPDRIQGLPDWLSKERYDFNARIADGDRADWQDSARQAAILPAMLQAALADRCKLAVHREIKQTSVYLLIVGKSGPKFAETNPADSPPKGVTLPGGAVLVKSDNTLNLYGTSMSFFATMLTGMAGRGQPTIVDRTGLTGRYNIILKSITSHPGQQPGSGEATDPDGSIFSAVEALGLKLEPGKTSVETLVIDHIERPSAN